MTELDDRIRAEGSIDLNHWWVTEHRVPRVDSFYCNWSVPVALVAGVEFPWATEEPTAEEVALVGKFIQYRNSRFYDRYINGMREKSLIDIDPGVNTLTLAKMDHSWVYRMHTWQQGPMFVPTKYPEVIESLALVELFDKIESIGGELFPKWVEFKAENNFPVS